MKIDLKARYTKTSEWVRKEGDLFVAGITDYAQSQLSDLVYVELPIVGKQFKQGEAFGVVESVKAASDIYMPMDGDIVEVNGSLVDEPGKVNENAFSAWLIKFKASAPSQFDALMDPPAYDAMIAKEQH